MNRNLLAGLCLALLPFSALATPITFTFAGSIDNDPFGTFDSASFLGTYTFDSNLPQVLSTPNSGGYADAGASVSMTVSFTGTLDPSVSGPYVANRLNISVNNNFPGPLDQFLVTGTSTLNSALSIELRLDDFTGTAFSNTLLPLTAPSLAAFTSVRFALFGGTLDDPIEAEGVLTSLRCSSGCDPVRGVPEPASLLLVGLAVAAFGTTRRRMKTHRVSTPDPAGI